MDWHYHKNYVKVQNLVMMFFSCIGNMEIFIGGLGF